MNLPTLIVRHQRENRKKCSLRYITHRPDMHFLTYPLRGPLPDMTHYFLLDVEGAPLTKEDASKGILLLDGHWKHVSPMRQILPPTIARRTLPSTLRTAYPRKQTDCPDPQRGLASIEALYIAYRLMGRPAETLLTDYYWKNPFLRDNAEVLQTLFPGKS